MDLWKGLYFIYKASDEKTWNLLELPGYFGVGGRRSVGVSNGLNSGGGWSISAKVTEFETKYKKCSTT